MSFCDRIHKSRSKNQDQPPQVYWLDDYDQLTIGHILAKGGMPWRAKRDSQRPNAYQAFVVIYRERVNPPLSQGRLARPYKEPPKPCQLATGNSSRDNDQDDDPFLEGVPSSDIGSIPSSSQPTLTLEQQPRSSEEPRRFKHYTLDSPTPPPLMLNPNEQNPSSSLTLSSWVKETSHSSTQSQKQNRANATTPTLPTTSQKSSFVDLTGVQDSGSDTESSLPSLRSYFAKKYPNGSWKQESIARQENQAEAVASSPGPDTAQSPVPQTEGLAAPRGSQNPARSPKVRELHSVTLGTGAASLDRHRSSSTLDTEMDTQRDLTNLDESETTMSSIEVASIPTSSDRLKVADNLRSKLPAVDRNPPHSAATRKRKAGEASTKSDSPPGRNGPKTHGYNTRRRPESHKVGYYGRLASGQ
ncbi:hypothetical protein F4781DRAFT_411028 [Annulohypoxylon bovei var. microspora]|nr:hypothetical protein F4781DRAFT_411028 [Annulohypoxylon bovei var. microspora]